MKGEIKIPVRERHLSQREIILHQRVFVERILRDETWYEGERRGCFVPENDPVVQHRLGEIILEVGESLRNDAVESLARRQ